MTKRMTDEEINKLIDEKVKKCYAQGYGIGYEDGIKAYENLLLEVITFMRSQRCWRNEEERYEWLENRYEKLYSKEEER